MCVARWPSIKTKHHIIGLGMIVGWLVISTPLKNMSSSVGMIIPKIWKNKNVPNHQPVGDNVCQKTIENPLVFGGKMW